MHVLVLISPIRRINVSDFPRNYSMFDNNAFGLFLGGIEITRLGNGSSHTVSDL